MSESPTRATATDEQRARVERLVIEDCFSRDEMAALDAVLADSKALARGPTRAHPRSRGEVMNDNQCPTCGSVQATLETTHDPSLDMISWSLRLPLLREAWGEGPTDLAESERLYALITEGERALGILPPEGKDA